MLDRCPRIWMFGYVVQNCKEKKGGKNELELQV